MSDVALASQYVPNPDVPQFRDGGGMPGTLNAARDRHFTFLRRPFFDDNDRPCVLFNRRGRYTTVKGVKHPVYEETPVRDLWDMGISLPVHNATTLRKEEWIELDRVILRAARYRLRAWADLAASNSYGGFNGMNKTILERETMSDPGEAFVDMDGLTEGRSDRPRFQLEGTPLPITHTDFWYGARELGISQSSGTPLDTTSGEAGGRRIAEMVEKTTIGNVTGITYGGNSTQVGGYSRTSAVYGYLNFPNRLVRTGLYLPTGNGRSGTGWKPSDTLADFLSCLDTMKAGKFFGPFMVYTSNDWDQYLDNDYILTGGNVATQTLRERLRRIDGIQDVRRLDMLFASTPSSSTGPGGESLNGTYPFTLIFVQMTPDVARAINGMDITTIQWESVGGMRLNFKIMCIQAPQLGADFFGNCGVMQATATHA